MITAIIIDDEPHCVTALRHDLDMFCPEVQVLETCSSAKDGILAIKKHKPQIVFLDIEMPVMTGFEMLQTMGSERDFQVIFTTAYDQFVLKALRSSAADYLLKPIDSFELSQAVERAEKISQSKQSPAQTGLLQGPGLGNMPDDERRIALPDRKGYEFVSPSEICYCVAQGAYTSIILNSNRKILISKPLGETEAMLPARLFERIHHSTIVNLAQVKHIKKEDGLFIVMSNGDSLSIARARKDQLMNRLGIK